MSLRVSVITVCLNSARTVADTLLSVNEQTHEEIEHVVVDGGSTDGTQALIRQRGERVAQFVSERDQGIYDAMNKGLALATGDVVGFLNADDVFSSPDSVSRIAEAFRPQFDACYGDVVYVSSSQPSRVIRHWRSGDYRPGLCSTGWAPPHPSLYVRRGLVESLGGFDATMRIAADFEFALRWLDVRGVRAAYIPEVLVRMRTGGVSNRSLRTILRGHQEMAQALRQHGYPAGWWWSLRRLAMRLPQVIARPQTPQA
jgi:glycosyltransferase involved in cell wall biosynthesis